MKNPPLSKPYFGLFWLAKLTKTLFTYFSHKIKPKSSLDGTLSPNTISFSEGLFCTVIFKNENDTNIRYSKFDTFKLISCRGNNILVAFEA